MTDAAPSSTQAADRYSERLTVPLWWWPIAAGVAALLGYEAQLAAYRATWSIVFYPIFALLFVWLLLSMGRVRLRVDADGALHADKAILPAEVIGRAATIPPSARSAAMGRQLDPAAFLVYRSWIKPMVLLVLDDPDDPTPYWLVSTRRPEQLLDALGVPDASLQQQS
ncbi:MAG: DUF3093 domain-containing protein [Gordonia sp. (in: high G+C Gram-positive bacteria)]|uniref:DUF3093 domain-containing protein n=1 Tax=Gordonia sp. (in: high G+C Gram-positive bacteria) TaxID=84139 RepID=UPI0039E57436